MLHRKNTGAYLNGTYYSINMQKIPAGFNRTSGYAQTNLVITDTFINSLTKIHGAVESVPIMITK